MQQLQREACADSVNVRNLDMRALVVTNMYPSPSRPALGGFVRDQVQRAAAHRRASTWRSTPSRPAASQLLLRAGIDLRRRFGGRALRRRPRALRAHRLARARGQRAQAGRDAARQRPLPPALAAHHDRRAPPHGPRRHADGGVRGRRSPAPDSGRDDRDPALRHRHRALPADGPPRRARAARPRSRRALPAVSLQPGARGQARRHRPRARRRRRAAADARQITPTSEVPAVDERRQRRRLPVATGRRSAWPASRRSRATSRCSRGRRACTPRRCAGSTARCCAEWDRDAWRAALAPHLAADDPRVAGRARALRVLGRRARRARRRRLALAGRGGSASASILAPPWRRLQSSLGAPSS